MDDLLKYFNDELFYLRNAGRLFAEAHPQLAKRLNFADPEVADPLVQQLTQAFAFLTARIQQSLNDGYAEVTDAFLDHLLPHLTRPIPSRTVLTLKPKPTITQAHWLPAQTPLICRVEQGSHYEFQTTQDTPIQPLRLTTTKFENAPFSQHTESAFSAFKSRLLITLERLNDQLTWSACQQLPLRFYLSAETETAYLLYTLLFNQLKSIRCFDLNTGQPLGTLEAAHLSPLGFKDEERLFPAQEKAFGGYRLLMEWFAFPQKFLFFELNWAELTTSPKAQALQLQFYFDQNKPGLEKKVDSNALSLNAFPAVNLYAHAAIPIHLDHTKFAYDVRPETKLQQQQAVYAVDNATMISCQNSMPLYPFFGAHYHQLKDGYLFWHTQRESAGNDTHLSTQGQNLQISFSNLKAEPWHTETAVVHLSLQCFNTDIQQKLYDEALNHQFHFKDNQHRFAERIDHCHPIAPVLNPTGTTAKRWQLITHLLLNTSPLLAESQSKPHPLKQLLRIYQINEDPMQSHLIDSMESVAVDYRISRIPVAGIHGFCNGVFVVIVLNEKHRQCAGTYLFGCVVHRLLTLYVSINNFVQLTFIDKSGETLYQWQPLIGTQANF